MIYFWRCLLLKERGCDGSGGLGKTESKVEYKLFAVGENAPRVQSTASAKEEGDDASAGTAIDAEAKAVSSAAKKKGQ